MLTCDNSVDFAATRRSIFHSIRRTLSILNARAHASKRAQTELLALRSFVFPSDVPAAMGREICPPPLQDICPPEITIVDICPWLGLQVGVMAVLFSFTVRIIRARRIRL